MRKCVNAEIRYVAWENMCMCICVHAVCVCACECDICVCMCMRYAHVIRHMICLCLSMLCHMHICFSAMHLTTAFVTSFVCFTQTHVYTRTQRDAALLGLMYATDRVYEGIAS